jgi:hypothetical protein
VAEERYNKVDRYPKKNGRGDREADRVHSKAARVSGVQAKSGRSTNGHFRAIKARIATPDRLSHYEAPRHTKRTEAQTEQHHGRSAVGNTLAILSNEKSKGATVRSYVSGRIKP